MLTLLALPAIVFRRAEIVPMDDIMLCRVLGDPLCR